MARYTCTLTVSASPEQIQSSLAQILRSCHFEIVYDSPDYLMAREVPGHVAFGKLVTVEALIDKSDQEDQQFNLNLVVKNGELPLQVNNHCWQMYNTVRDAVAESRQWLLLEAVPS